MFKHIKIELKWAILFSLASLFWMFMERLLGWHDEKIADHYWLTLLFLPIGIFLTALALKEKRRRFFEGKMTWLQGFVTGAKMTVFIALLSPLFNWVTHKYITPKYFENIIEYSITNELSTIEAANAYFNINNYMWQSAIGTLLGGLVISALAALFLRRS